MTRVKLGMANSRMKDFYDLLILSQSFAFEGELLCQAIRATFERRNTELPDGVPFALSVDFSADRMKMTQWLAFLRKSGADSVGDLRSVCDSIDRFVREPLVSLASQTDSFQKRWPAGGPWI